MSPRSDVDLDNQHRSPRECATLVSRPYAVALRMPIRPFATYEINVRCLLNDLRISAERMKAIEPQMWIYDHTSILKKES